MLKGRVPVPLSRSFNSLQRRFREHLARLKRLEESIEQSWKPSWREEGSGDEEWWKRALIFQQCVKKPIVDTIHRALAIVRNRKLDSEFGSHIARTRHDDEVAKGVRFVFAPQEHCLVEIDIAQSLCGRNNSYTKNEFFNFDVIFRVLS